MDLALALQKAMPRMGDTSYFVRILINALQDEHEGETGYGIYVGEVNHEESYEYKEVDLTNNTVTIGDLTKPIDKFISSPRYSFCRESDSIGSYCPYNETGAGFVVGLAPSLLFWYNELRGV
jgi:hypothetical protein